MLFWGTGWGAGTTISQDGQVAGFANTVFRPATEPRNSELIFVDGTGVYRGALYSESNKEEFLNRRVHNLDVEDFGRYARGAFALYLCNSVSKECVIAPDPLGGAIVYIYGNSRFGAASTCLVDLVDFLKLHGVHLTKSSDYFLELVASESGGLGADTSYEQIRVLPLFSYVKVSEGIFHECTYRTASDFFYSDCSSAELFEETVEDIKLAAKTYASHGPKRICHLTAGLDSRLVAASLSNQEVSESFSFFCAEDAVTQEQRIAKEVAGHAGLTMTHYTGNRVALAAANPVDETRMTLASSGGLRSTGPHVGYCRTENLVLSGVYGGQLRSTYSSRVPREKLSAADIIENIWPSALLDPERGVAKPSAITRLEGVLDHKLQAMRSVGIREDALGDFLYINTRARYWGGHSLIEASRYTSHGTTLYSLAGQKLALESDLDSRASGLLIFDLYKELDPRMLEIRFDQEKFGRRVYTNRERPAVVEAANSPAPNWDYSTSCRPEIAPSSFGRSVQSSKEDLDRAKRLKVKLWMVSTEREVRSSIAEHLAGGDSNLSQSFNLRQLRRLISRPARNRPQLRTIHGINRYMEWFSD